MKKSLRVWINFSGDIMLKRLFFISVSAIAAIFMSCSNSTDPSEVSLDAKIGRMLLIGFRGTEVNASDQIVKDISTGRVGGVVLFDKDVALGGAPRNIESPEQVRTLINQLKGYARGKLIVAVDQEGGKVARLKPEYGFPATVSQQYLGDLNNPDTTRKYGIKTTQTLSAAGFNVNFAPVVDLNVNPSSPAIGALGRSFSADPDVVVENAELLIEKFHSNRIMGTLKHFPGHGSATTDSHGGFTDVTDTWSEKELEPFARIIDDGMADAVMTAHIYNRNWDSIYPATLSHNVITGMLRERLGFDGVVISDDMNMGAIADNYGLEQAIELSINAGCDIICIANNLVYDEMIAVKATEIIKKLLEEGRITEERIDESYERIMRLTDRIDIIFGAD